METESRRRQPGARAGGPRLTAAQKGRVEQKYEELRTRNQAQERCDRRLFVLVTALALVTVPAVGGYMMVMGQASEENWKLLMGSGTWCGSLLLILRLLNRRLIADRAQDVELHNAQVAFMTTERVVPVRARPPAPGLTDRGWKKRRRPRRHLRRLGTLRRTADIPQRRRWEWSGNPVADRLEPLRIGV
ncbi:MAG TPA: hypothetical protein VF006_33350 [Longimicrobium sp.]